jgi:large subunit ribosomal protein L17
MPSKKLFDDIAQKSTNRNGGYTRIVKLGRRKSDSAPMAFLEWVDAAQVTEEKSAEEKKARRKEAEPKPKEKEAKREEPKREEEPTAKEEKPSAPAPEEPKPKKRRWFGKKTGQDEK